MSVFRFLPGILVVQLATAALVVAGMDSVHGGQWIPLALFGGITSLIAGFWFGSIADHVKKDALSAVVAGHTRERENIRLAAESEKRAALEESHRRILRESRRAHTRANIKLGFGVLVLMGLGGALLAIEFMTVGLLVMATAGGALGGYVLRARQDQIGARADGGTVYLPAQSPGHPAESTRFSRLGKKPKHVL